MSNAPSSVGSARFPNERRYPIKPLERLITVRLRDRGLTAKQVTARAIAAECGEPDSNVVARARKIGLRRVAAERLAEAAGFLPYEIWPEILCDAIEEAEAASKACERCGLSFLPRNGEHRFCSKVCQRRDYWRRTHPLPEMVRACAADGCVESFELGPGSGGRNRIYCSDRCRARMSMRAYRQTEAGRQANRTYVRRYKAEVRQMKQRRAERRAA